MRSIIRSIRSCDGEGRLTGLVRGEELFAKQAIEISAQSGKMVGVDKEERLGDAAGAQPASSATLAADQPAHRLRRRRRGRHVRGHAERSSSSSPCSCR